MSKSKQGWVLHRIFKNYNLDSLFFYDTSYIGEWKSKPKESTILKHIKRSLKWAKEYNKATFDSIRVELIHVDFITPWGSYVASTYIEVDGEWRIQK